MTIGNKPSASSRLANCSDDSLGRVTRTCFIDPRRQTWPTLQTRHDFSGPVVQKIGSNPLSQGNSIRSRRFTCRMNEFLAIREALPDYLKGFVTFAYKTGWRVNEIVTLTWAQVNRKEWYVRIEGDHTKNEEARTIYLDNELREVFQVQWEGRKHGRKIYTVCFSKQSRNRQNRRFSHGLEKCL